MPPKQAIDLHSANAFASQCLLAPVSLRAGIGPDFAVIEDSLATYRRLVELQRPA